jgi:hypothetical protein
LLGLAAKAYDANNNINALNILKKFMLVPILIILINHLSLTSKDSVATYLVTS